MTKGEIRGLLSGDYPADDGDCMLDIFVDDEGIHIIHIDFAVDFYYHYIIDQYGSLVDFCTGSTLPDIDQHI